MHKILIVDDEPMLLTILTESLKKYAKKYAITTAKDGLSAIMHLKNRPFDLVITDINMPIINGLVLLAYMHNNFPKIPCIAMTGFGTPFLEKRMRQESSHYIEKPFSIDLLLRAIRSVLKTGVLSGTLNGISVEGFLKMIELEMITCLCEIRSSDSAEGKGSGGYLYFEQGELYQAYYGRLKGNKAALKIFRMNDVAVKFRKPSGKGHIAKKITKDAEGLMLQAMRQRDEIETPEVKQAIEKKRARKQRKKERLKQEKVEQVFQKAKKRADLVEKKLSQNKSIDSDEKGALILTDISRKVLAT